MGFDNKLGHVTPERLTDSKNKTWADIAERSEKVVTFLDLCGH